MNRRKFIKNILGASTAVAVVPAVLVTAEATSQIVADESVVEYTWDLVGARDRQFTLRTGQKGMEQFNKAIQEETKKWSPDDNLASRLTNNKLFEKKFNDLFNPTGNGIVNRMNKEGIVYDPNKITIENIEQVLKDVF